MTKAELLRLVDRMGRFWPQTGLFDAERADPKTLEAWHELLGPLPFSAGLRAVDQLAREGREFCPPPGVVFSYAETIALAEKPRLVVASDPTSEDRERAKRRVKGLRDQLAELAAKKSMA